jgi:tetrahydromethanopterin S-methyltransferase subunit G
MMKTLCAVSLGVLILAAGSTGAQAAVAPSRSRAESQRERSVERVRRLLREERVAKRLAAMGMKRGEIEKRLERMNDAQIQRLADRLEDLAVGRSAAGIVVGLLIIAALVLLIIFLAERL